MYLLLIQTLLRTFTFWTLVFNIILLNHRHINIIFLRYYLFILIFYGTYVTNRKEFLDHVVKKFEIPLNKVIHVFICNVVFHVLLPITILLNMKNIGKFDFFTFLYGLPIPIIYLVVTDTMDVYQLNKERILKEGFLAWFSIFIVSQIKT